MTERKKEKHSLEIAKTLHYKPIWSISRLLKHASCRIFARKKRTLIPESESNWLTLNPPPRKISERRPSSGGFRLIDSVETRFWASGEIRPSGAKERKRAERSREHRARKKEQNEKGGFEFMAWIFRPVNSRDERRGGDWLLFMAVYKFSRDDETR